MIPAKVVFIDNGVIQRRQRTESQNGQPMLDAIRLWFGQGGGDVGFAVPPFFWIELSGVTNEVIERMDKICEELPSLQKAEDLGKWFMQSLSAIFKIPELAAEIQSSIDVGLQKHRGWFLPGIEARIFAMWESEKRDPAVMVRHLAVDRLAIRLTRKNCQVTQECPIEVGDNILPLVAELIEHQPGISPYRLLLIAWEPAYANGKLTLKKDEYHHLAEKSDLLDGDSNAI